MPARSSDIGKVFRSGRDQAVRLPRGLRFEEDEVIVRRVGDVVMMCPRSKVWDAFEESLKHFPSDFMANRNQPLVAEDRVKID